MLVPRQDLSAKIYKTYCKSVNEDKFESIISLLNYNDLDISGENNVALYKLANENYKDGVIKFINHPNFKLIEEEYDPFIQSAIAGWGFLFNSLLEKFEVPLHILLDCFKEACYNEDSYIVGLILTYKDFITFCKENKEFNNFVEETNIKMKNFVIPYLKAQDF